MEDKRGANNPDRLGGVFCHLILHHDGLRGVFCHQIPHHDRLERVFCHQIPHHDGLRGFSAVRSLTTTD